MPEHNPGTDPNRGQPAGTFGTLVVSHSMPPGLLQDASTGSIMPLGLPSRVSAILVVDRPDRVEAARVAVLCFLGQTYPNKELIIANTTGERVLQFSDHSDILEIPYTPGVEEEIWDRAVGFAAGEWVIRWDADCWHHPDRIRHQIEMTDGKYVSVMLQQQIRVNLLRHIAFVHTDALGIGETILHPRDALVPSNREALPNKSNTDFEKVLTIGWYDGVKLWNDQESGRQEDAWMGQYRNETDGSCFLGSEEVGLLKSVFHLYGMKFEVVEEALPHS